MKKEKYSLVEILDGIKRGDNKTLLFIYEEYFNVIEKMVVLRGGSRELAQDIFQESLVVIYKKLHEGDLSNIESSFFTYLYSVAKIKLYHHFRTMSSDILSHSNPIVDDEVSDQNFTEVNKYVLDGIKEALYHKYLKLLPIVCYNILRWYAAGVKVKDIMTRIGFVNEIMVRKTKLNCLEKLITMIKNDPNSKHVL